MPPTIRNVGSDSPNLQYSVGFFGDDELNVTVTHCDSVIRSWINDLFIYDGSGTIYTNPLVVGVGVQWNLVSNDYSDPPPDDYYDPPPNLLQLCVGKRCIIIQLSHCDLIPEDLRDFLKNPEAIFVGIWNGEDARKLAQSRHRLEIRELRDIRHYVSYPEERWSLRSYSFEEIVQQWKGDHGIRLDMEFIMSDWSVNYINHDQILYASFDVYVCHELSRRVVFVFGNVEKLVSEE